MIIIVDRLKDYLQKEGLSVPKLSKELKIPQDRIYSWLRGKGNPKSEDYKKLENLLGIGTNPKDESSKDGEVDDDSAEYNSGSPSTGVELPGMYQKIIERIMESSKAQEALAHSLVQISNVLIEERKLMRDTAQHAMSVVQEVGSIVSSLETLRMEAQQRDENFHSFRLAVAKQIAKARGMDEDDIFDEIDNEEMADPSDENRSMPPVPGKKSKVSSTSGS